MADNSSNNAGCVTIGIIVVIIAFVALTNGNVGGGVFFLIFGVIILVIAANINDDSKILKNSSNPPPIPSELQYTLQIKVTKKEEKIQDMRLMLLKFHTKGIFSTHLSISKPCFEFRLCDVTDESKSNGLPVLCLIDDLQADNSTEFRFRQIFPQSFNAGDGSTEWVEICAIPLDFLVFPNSGFRKIKATLQISDVRNGNLIATVCTEWATTVDGVGYLEKEAEQSKAQAASLQLAMCIAAADGKIDNHEVEVIKSWGERTVKSLPHERQSERRKVLNEALQKATNDIKAKLIYNLELNAIHTLKNTEELRYLYDAYELCLNVLKADGEAHPEEMAQLTRLAKKLNLDETKIRILTDRHLSEVRFTKVENDSGDDQILGITSDMNKDQIRKHLNKLYSKHQARTQHDDPEVVIKAKDWLDRIARARVRHLSK